MTTIDQVISKIQEQCSLLVDNLKLDDNTIEPYVETSEEQIPFIENDAGHKDIFLINNSFIYRDGLKTKKNEKYLGLIKLPPKKEDDIVVVSGLVSNSDWKKISSKSDNYPHIQTLREAVIDAKTNLGTIVYILVGLVGDTLTVVEGPINSNEYNRLILDSQIEGIIINGKSITVNPQMPNYDIEQNLEEQLNIPKNKKESFFTNFFISLTKLRKEVYRPLEIPEADSDVEQTFLDILLDSLSKEIEDYKTSLANWNQAKDEEADFNNILRIAYNFTGDILKLIRLTIHICDLKPLLLWMTINSHYKLFKAFKNIDWQQSNKPSLSEYENLIKGVRNARFHNFLDIKNTLEVNLEGIMLEARKMTFFGEYQRTGTSNTFEYEDQQLIEVFTEFSRASENLVSDEFWNKNLEVLEATYQLVDDICYSLKILRLLEE